MTSKKDNDRIDDLKAKVDRHGWLLEEKVMPSLEKIEETLEENIGGIKLASLLNSKIIAVVLGGMVMAGIYFAAKTGGIGL